MRQSDKVLLAAMCVFDALLAIFDFAYASCWPAGFALVAL